MTQLRRTTCMACSQQCGLLVEVEGEAVTAIRGDPEHPVSRGFICPKGANAHQALSDENRLRQVLRRRGERGSGRWDPVGWDEALDEIAERLRSVSATYGPESVAASIGTLHGSDWGLAERFLNLFGSPNTVTQNLICAAPNAVAEGLTYGWGLTMSASPVPGVTQCDVLWGMRPAASRPLLWRAIQQSRKLGSALIVVDPERTREAEAADLHLQNLPGTDTALALGIMSVLVREGLYAADFVREHTVGFDALRGRLAQYGVARVSRITAVPEERIVHAARMLGSRRPAMIHGGNGLCHSGPNAVQAGRALACLIALTGNLEVRGGHTLAGPPRDVVAGGRALDADALGPAQRAKRLGGDTYPLIGAGAAELDEVIARHWHGVRGTFSWCSSAHEPALWRAILEGVPYPVGALLVQYHNVLGASPDAAMVQRALTSERLGLLVVQDLFPTMTTHYADYVLPAAHWLEKPFYSASLGYVGLAGDRVEAGPPAVRSDVPSDYDLWRDLGARLGQGPHWPAEVERFYDSLLEPAGTSFAAVAARSGPVRLRERRAPRETGPAPRFATPSGRVEFASSLMRSWGLDPLPGFEVPPGWAVDRSRFPLLLVTGGRNLTGFHQSAHRAPWYRKRNPDPEFKIHPDVASRLGLATGQWAALVTPHGQVSQRALLTDRIHPGLVQADRWWYPERGEGGPDPFGFWGSNINVCTSQDDGCDPVMGSWLLRGVPCAIVPGRDGD